MTTASHSGRGVRRGSPGDLASFLRVRSILTTRTALDNNEGGNMSTVESAEILAGAENRTTPRLRHDPAKI